MINQIEELIKDAKFSIDFNQREIVARTLNLEVSPDNSWEKGMLDCAKEKLAQAEHRLARLTEKMEEVNSKSLPESNGVTRFEVIDATGRVLVLNGVNVKLDYQDNGQTLKVFIS
jgi:hypothetical protein